MTDSRTAPDPDRLPWLTDKARGSRTSDWQPVLLWALFATLLVASVSYWLGTKSVTVELAHEETQPSPGIATVKLPEPVRSAPEARHGEAPAMPQVQPIAPPPMVRIAVPQPVEASPPRKSAAKPSRKVATSPEPTSHARQPETRANPTVDLPAWPATSSAGADGRMVRIGTFSSRAQAKRGWRQIVRAYPGMTRLKAVVVPNPSLRNGRTYYRLQFGTTSQAHSAVLCQRMRMIAQSCVAVGRPSIQGAAQ